MPSFLTYERRSNFERLVLDIFGQSTVSFVTQPEADLAWYTFKTPLQANRGDYVIFCHADEEITVY
jgi:hypothetical protein